MLVEYQREFLKKVAKIKSTEQKNIVKKKIEKIIENPAIGKPMRYARKNTREVYISPYRLAYLDNKIIFLDIYHKDDQ